MARYVCTVKWVDLKDNRHVYNAGEKFPRDGLIVPESRIKLLLGSDNLAGKPVIRIAEEPKPVEEPVLTAEEPKAPKKRVRKNA